MSEGVLPPPPESPREPPSLSKVLGYTGLALLWIDFLRDPAKAHGAVTISLTTHFAADYWFELKEHRLFLSRWAAALVALWGWHRGEGWMAVVVTVIGIASILFVEFSKSDS